MPYTTLELEAYLDEQLSPELTEQALRYLATKSLAQHRAPLAPLRGEGLGVRG